jgi:hypothetical protein
MAGLSIGSHCGQIGTPAIAKSAARGDEPTQGKSLDCFVAARLAMAGGIVNALGPRANFNVSFRHAKVNAGRVSPRCIGQQPPPPCGIAGRRPNIV